MNRYSEIEYQNYDPKFTAADIAAANDQFQQINPEQTTPEPEPVNPPLPYLSNDPKWTLVPTAMRCVSGYELNSLINNIAQTNSTYSDELSQTKELLARTINRVDEMARRMERLNNDLTKIKEWVTAVDEFLNHIRSQIKDLMAQIDPVWVSTSPAPPVLSTHTHRSGFR